jgi:hypothetical protein
MARPERHDVDYFPFFVKRGKTLNILQSKYGLEGIGFFTNLLRFLSSTPDHYYCIKEEYDKLNFFAEIGIDNEEKGISMLELMVKTAKFDKDLWENHKVIASEAFLKSLEPAYEKRNNQVITIEAIRERFESGGINPVSGGVNAEESDKSEVSGVDNPQSKVKKSKVKKSKEKIDSNSEPKKLFLDIWQHTPDVFNALARIESPNEWANYWENSGITCGQIQSAMDNFIADVRSGAIEPRFVPSMPDRFVLKGWIVKCQKRFSPKTTAPPHGTAPPNIVKQTKKSL